MTQTDRKHSLITAGVFYLSLHKEGKNKRPFLTHVNHVKDETNHLKW